MSKTALRVEGLSKRYRLHLGHRPKYRTLRDIFSGGVKDNITKVSATVRGEDYLENSSSSVWALKDVSFEVQSGEAIGIIGPNGAGKSTLLKLLTRITEPTRGSADVYGTIGSLLEVGVGFHRELTGRENVYLTGAIYGMKREEVDRKFDEIVAFSEIEKFIDTPVKRYSSGMQVRLAFSVAAHLNPDILLVDEVLAVGDAAFQRKCIQAMENIAREGRTILFVSHHMPSVMRLCSRVLLLSGGRLLRDGEPQAVVNEYLRSNVASASLREWPDERSAPGNHVARLRAVRLLVDGKQPGYAVDTSRPVTVEMEYDVIHPGYVLYPVISLVNEEDVRIFNSVDTDPTWRGVARPVGHYKSTSVIPANLLSEGVMVLGAEMRTETPYMLHFKIDDLLSFQAIRGGKMLEMRREFSGIRPGIVQPELEWETRYRANGHNP